MIAPISKPSTHFDSALEENESVVVVNNQGGKKMRLACYSDQAPERMENGEDGETENKMRRQAFQQVTLVSGRILFKEECKMSQTLDGPQPALFPEAERLSL